MTIDDYTFGRIVIDGKTYTRDVIIAPDGSVTNWWRREGHRLALADLEDVLEGGAKTLVIGTGASGVMKVPDGVVDDLESSGIEVIIARTREAAQRYNQLQGEGVWAAFHLTC